MQLWACVWHQPKNKGCTCTRTLQNRNAGFWLKNRRTKWMCMCAAGARVIMEGDVGDKFYIIKEGEAQVIQGDREVNRLFRSDFFGEQALLQDEPRCVAAGWRVGLQRVAARPGRKEAAASLRGLGGRYRLHRSAQ